jgi:hypothetical protein
MKKKQSLLIICLFFSVAVFSQNKADSSKQDSVKIKKGWTLGLLPVVAYDSDLGFQYGGLVNFYNYGDGSSYPTYRHSIKLEISRFTKGSGVNQLLYDSKYLLPKNIRITADLSYLTEQALDFYGFNGFEAYYNPDYEDDKSGDYISRMYYRHARNTFRIVTDFQGNLYKKKLRWLAGFSYFNTEAGSVDIARLNEGKSAGDRLPDTMSLYDKYVNWGIIEADESKGGNIQMLKFGLVYDTRDQEANAMKGMWTELLLATAPSFLGNDKYHFTKLAFTHRQYFTIIKKKLSFVYRLGYQGTIAGRVPFYFQPYQISSFAVVTKSDGLGGAKTLRGVLRNRVVGNDVAYANLELRWKFWKGFVGKQNVYLMLNGFCDGGMVLDPIDVDRSKVPVREIISEYFVTEQDYLHVCAGLGLRIVLNENFIVAADYGRAFDKRDGVSGLYINVNNLF